MNFTVNSYVAHLLLTATAPLPSLLLCTSSPTVECINAYCKAW
jgi:hypothetical protein